MKKILSVIFCMFGLSVFSLSAQSEKLLRVADDNGNPVSGATVSVVNNPTVSVKTDADGQVFISVPNGEYVDISYPGMANRRVRIDGDMPLIMLGSANREFSTGVTRTNAEQMTQAIASVTADEIARNSHSRVGEVLYGLLPGVFVMQNGGYFTNNNFFVRGAGTLSNQQPLFVVDGFPRAMENITVAEIERITVLKDGAATALWGSRGANGVISVDTKRGLYNTMDFSVGYNAGIGFQTKTPTMADGYTYANALNEALVYDGMSERYNPYELDAFRTGRYPDLYPDTDWLREGLRDMTFSNQLNFIFRGGGERTRYFSVIDYRNDYGLFKYTDYHNDHNSRLLRNDLNLRLNLDTEITSSTLFKVSILGLLTQQKRPGAEINTIVRGLYTVPSAAFPVFTAPGMWGSDNYYQMNPLAEIASTGFNKFITRMLQSDMRLKQYLTFITPGLSVEAAVAYDNSAVFWEGQSKKYAYQVNVPTMNPVTGELTKLTRTTYGEETALSYTSSLGNQFMNTVLEGNLKYDRVFGCHGINAAAIYRQESSIGVGRNNTYKRQYILGTVSYAFNGRLFIDGVINYYGSSVLSKGNRFKLYPALSRAYVLLNNQGGIDLLKVRASAGQSGLDALEYELDRQYWENGNNYFFTASNTSYAGVMEGTLAVKNLKCETATKYNIGMDATVFKGLSASLDMFYERRSNIPVSGSSVYSSAIGVGIPLVNGGVVDSKGGELCLMWHEKRGNLTYYAGGNVSFARTRIIENNEGFVPYAHLSKIGNRIGQIYGLEAVGYFDDQADINRNLTQTFGTVRPGDIRYANRNGDDKIDSEDMVAIGYSAIVPEWYYGIRLGIEYKSFGIHAVFQGVANYSVMLNTPGVYWPLQNNTNISTWYLEDNVRWTEQTKSTANLPRLSSGDNPNNYRASTQWLADASFFKLRNLQVYYNLPEKIVHSLKLKKIQVYASGNDLFSIDNVPYFNVEDIGLKYPALSYVFLGMNVNF